MIRVACVNDAYDISRIYAKYVEETNISFEYVAPSVEEMKRRIETTLKQYPYLVIDIDNHVVGYAYASAYHSRAAYQWDCELSIYLDENYHGKSMASLLYQSLLDILKIMHIQNVYACITYPNIKSERFHERFGFSIIGYFHKVGYKKGLWHDVKWVEKSLNDDCPPLDVIPFSSLTSTQIESCLHNSLFKREEI